MKITPEMIAKFEQCQSAEEIMSLAKQEKISITMDQARKAFELLSSEDVADNVMEKVTGGGFWRCGEYHRSPCAAFIER